MLDYFEDKGEWAGLPITLQGIFEDGKCMSIKVIDLTTGTPISWTFPPLGDPTCGYNGKPGDLRQGFMNVAQRLYDERKNMNTTSDQKKYIGIISRREVLSAYQFGESEELKRVEFETTSLQAAKARITRLAMPMEFGKDSDGTPRLGKEERWRAWHSCPDYEQENGILVSWCSRITDTNLWHFDEARNLTKYKLYIDLYWRQS